MRITFLASKIKMINVAAGFRIFASGLRTLCSSCLSLLHPPEVKYLLFARLSPVVRVRCG